MKRSPIRTTRTKPRRKAKPKRPSRRTLRNKADRLFSLYIRQRDGACVVCGAGPGQRVLQCGHILSRRYGHVRWNPDNAVTLCLQDHKRFTEDPLRWEQFIEAKFPGRLTKLKLRALAIDSKPDPEAAVAALELLLKPALSTPDEDAE